MKFFRPLFAPLTIIFIILLLARPAVASSIIPFVGCAVEGQDGTAPTGGPVQVEIPAFVSAHLSLYAGGYQTALAPRGWSCSATEGEAEDALIIYPKNTLHDKDAPIVAVFSWNGDAEFGIEMMMKYGGTYFPKIITKNDVENFILNSGVSETDDDFLVPYYLNDKVKFLNKGELQFFSARGEPGLGNTILDKSFKFDTDGIIAISDSPDGGGIYFFTARLPEMYKRFSNYILTFQKNCYANEQNK